MRVITLLLAWCSFAAGQFGDMPPFGKLPLGLGGSIPVHVSGAPSNTFVSPIGDSLIVAFWSMDGGDTTVDVVDSSGYDWNANTAGSFVVGKVDSALNLNAGEDVDLRNINNVGTHDFTITMWVNLSNLASNHTLVSDYSSTGYYIAVNTSGNVYAKVRGSTTNVAVTNSSISLSPGTWYHVAVIRDASDATTGLKIKINNGVATTGPQDTGDITDPASFCIGSLIGAYWLEGKVDDIWYFFRTLTDSELTTLYNRGN